MEAAVACSHQDTLAEIGLRFGANVIHHRLRLRLSQEELARRASLHRDAIYKVEHGERRPRIDTLLKLCGALEVSAADLLVGIDWVPSTIQPAQGAVVFARREDMAFLRRHPVEAA